MGGIPMAMRFPDLQVIVPRSVEVSRVQGVASHQQVHDQQSFAQRHVAELVRAQTQVQRKEEKKARVRRDEESTDTPGRRYRARQAAARHEEKDDGDTGRRTVPVGDLGRRIDIQA